MLPSAVRQRRFHLINLSLLAIDGAFAAGALAIGELLASPIDLPQFRFLRQPRVEGIPLVQRADLFGLRPRGSMLAMLIIGLISEGLEPLLAVLRAVTDRAPRRTMYILYARAR